MAVFGRPPRILQAVVLLDETAMDWAILNRRSRHGALDTLRDAVDLLHDHHRAKFQARHAASSAEH
jgi:hypothetical protein